MEKRKCTGSENGGFRSHSESRMSDKEDVEKSWV